MSWLRIKELVRKEFIQLMRDKRNRVILVLAPLVQMLVFGYVVNYDISNIRVALDDQSKTKTSREFIAAFEKSGIFHVTHHVRDDRQTEQLLLLGKVDMAVEIGPDFESLIRKGQTAQIQIIADGSVSNMAAMRMAYTTTIIEKFNRDTVRKLYPQHLSYARIDARIRTWYNPNLDSRHFFVPGIVAFLIMLTSLLLTSIAVIREKEAGTMEQLIVTPLKSYEFILGKTIPYIMISLVQLLFIIVTAIYWFEIPLVGSIPLLIFASLIFLLSTLGIGLLISSVSATQQQAMMITFFFLMPFFMLSGFVFPVSNMPTVIQWLTFLNPLRHFLVIIRGIFLKGVGLDVLWPQFLVLVIMGGVVFTMAIARFKKRLD